MIEEIVVTAQKKEESLREVPISVSVLDADFMVEQAISDFRDVALTVPNVVIDNNGQFTDVRIRGFGSPFQNKAFEQSVGLMIDGIPYGLREYFLGPLFDLERIEVLRGPQGTLIGKNTTAGLFNVVTKKPTDELEGYVDVEVGDFGRQNLTAAVGGPLVADFLSVRLAGLSEDVDGYVTNTTASVEPSVERELNERNREGIRAQLAFLDLLGANLVVGYEHVENDAIVGGWEFLIAQDDVRPFFREYDPGTNFEPFDYVGSVDESVNVIQRFDTFVANASIDVADWRLDAVGGYAVLDQKTPLTDADFTPAPVFIAKEKDRNTQATFEIRTNSPSLPGLLGLERLFGFALGSSDLTVGFFYQRREILDSESAAGINAPVLAEFLVAQGVPLSQVPGGPNISVLPFGLVVPLGPALHQALFDSGIGYEETTAFFEQTGSSYAGFSQLEWRFVERWSLQYGMRFTAEDKDADLSRADTAGVGLTSCTLGLCPFTQSLSRSEFAFTPKVALIWDWSDDANLFATWGRGFKSGGFNALPNNNDDLTALVFEPEETTSWEIGTKTRLLDGAAAANVTAFWQNATDLQVFTIAPPLAQLRVTNAGEARSRGFEADVTWLASDWLTMRGSVGFADAEFLEFPFGACTTDRQDTDGDGDSRCDLSGQPPPRTPKWTATITPSVRWPLGWYGIDATATLAVLYQDVQFADFTNDPRTRRPSFFRLNGGIGLQDVERGWSIALRVENMTDVSTPIQVREITAGQRNFAQLLESPRMIFGAFRWTF